MMSVENPRKKAYKKVAINSSVFKYVWQNSTEPIKEFSGFPGQVATKG